MFAGAGYKLGPVLGHSIARQHGSFLLVVDFVARLFSPLADKLKPWQVLSLVDGFQTRGLMRKAGRRETRP